MSLLGNDIILRPPSSELTKTKDIRYDFLLRKIATHFSLKIAHAAYLSR